MTYLSRIISVTLKTKSCRNANIDVTGGTVGCHNDNLRCHQWRQSWHYDNSWFSVYVNSILFDLHIFCEMPIIVIMFYWCLIACDWLAIFFFLILVKIKLEMSLCIAFILLSAQTLHDPYKHLFNAINTTVAVAVDVLSICMTSWHEHAFLIARHWRVYLVVSLNYLLNEELTICQHWFR